MEAESMEEIVIAIGKERYNRVGGLSQNPPLCF